MSVLRSSSKTKIVSVRLSEEELKRIDRLVRLGIFINRSEFIKWATKLLIRKMAKKGLVNKNEWEVAR